jgi:hypothetical protein
MPPSNPQWFMLAVGLFGGLVLFLYGLEQLSEGLKHAAGDALKTLFTRLTSNRFLGALTGPVVTGILNSSSVTTDPSNPEGPTILRLQANFVDSLRQIFTLAKRIARTKTGKDTTESPNFKPETEQE